MKIVTRKINRFGVRKYASVKSFTRKNVQYTVGKVRKRNSKHYKYICTCPDYFYRQEICKHIKKFKSEE
jgi:hypothetical protein